MDEFKGKLEVIDEDCSFSSVQVKDEIPNVNEPLLSDVDGGCWQETKSLEDETDLTEGMTSMFKKEYKSEITWESESLDKQQDSNDQYDSIMTQQCDTEEKYGQQPSITTDLVALKSNSECGEPHQSFQKPSKLNR